MRDEPDIQSVEFLRQVVEQWAGDQPASEDPVCCACLWAADEIDRLRDWRRRGMLLYTTISSHTGLNAMQGLLDFRDWVIEQWKREQAAEHTRETP